MNTPNPELARAFLRAVRAWCECLPDKIAQDQPHEEKSPTQATREPATSQGAKASA